MRVYSKAAVFDVAEVLSLATVGLSQGSAAEVAAPKLEIRLPKEEFLEGEPIPFTLVLPETDAAPDATIVLTSRFRARLVTRVRGQDSQGKSADEWVPLQLRNRLKRVGEAIFATYIPRCGSLRKSGREIPPLLEVKLEVAGDWRCDRITLSQTGLSNTFRIRAVSRDGIPQEYCRLLSELDPLQGTDARSVPSDLIDLAAGIEGAYAVFARWLVLRASGPRLYSSVEDPRFKWGWIAEAARTCLAAEQAKLSDEVEADALAALAYSGLARRDKRAFVESAVKYEEKFGRVFPKPQLRGQLDRFLWEDFQEQCDTMLKEGRDAPQARKRLLRTYCEFWRKQDYSVKNSLSTLLQEDEACRDAAVSILSDVRVPGKVRGAILFYLARNPFDERERVVVDAALGKLDSSTYLRDVALRCFPLIERRAAQSALVALLRERMARGDDLPWTYAMCVELEAFDCLDLLEQLSRGDASAFQALSQLRDLMGQ